MTRDFSGKFRLSHARVCIPVLTIFAVIVPIGALGRIFRMMARGHTEVKRVVLIETIVAFPAKVLVSVILILLGWGLVGWIIGELVSYLVLCVGFGALAFHLTPVSSRRPQWALHESLIYKFTATMTGMTALGLATGRLGSFLLAIFLNPAAVGIYSVAVTMAGISEMVQSAANSTFAPHLVQSCVRAQSRGKSFVLSRHTLELDPHDAAVCLVFGPA